MSERQQIRETKVVVEKENNNQEEEDQIYENLPNFPSTNNENDVNDDSHQQNFRDSKKSAGIDSFFSTWQSPKSTFKRKNQDTNHTMMETCHSYEVEQTDTPKENCPK